MAAQPPRPRLPPLSALRAFEAAGRLGGFAPAALELGVTPGAITAHLKTLEAALGVMLFDRQHKGVALTDLGTRVLPDFTRAFRALDAAMQRLETEAAPDLVHIATTSDLAQLWLSPRLPALRLMGLQIAILTLDTPEAARSLADIALFVRAGEGTPAPLIAVAAPSLARDLRAPADLDPARALTLAGLSGDWIRWAQAAGIAGFQPRGPVHAQAALALEEAANGAGVLVIAEPLAQQAIAAGRLTALFGTAAPSGLSLGLWPLRDLPPGSAAAQALAALGPPSAASSC